MTLTSMERDDLRRIAARGIAELEADTRKPAITANRVHMYVVNHASGGNDTRNSTRRDVIRALRELGYNQVGIDGIGHDRDVAWAMKAPA